MLRFSILSAVLGFVLVPGTGWAGIVFGPVKAQAGQSIRMVSHSETPGASMQRSREGKNSSGTLSVTRDRELFWTFREPAPDGTRRGMVRVAKMATSSVVRMDGQEEKTDDSSPLAGRMFAMTKSPEGEWKFELDGSVPYSRVHKEIDELTVYLKRRWYPDREVNIGDSWEFDPAWVKMLIEKDLSRAQTIGTMRLRQVRHTQRGGFAVMDVSIRSTGADFRPDGSESSASIELTGQVVVNLQSMLDEELELKGTVTSSSRKPGESTTVTMPVRLSVTKSFVRDGGLP